MFSWGVLALHSVQLFKKPFQNELLCLGKLSYICWLYFAVPTSVRLCGVQICWRESQRAFLEGLLERDQEIQRFHGSFDSRVEEGPEACQLSLKSSEPPPLDLNRSMLCITSQIYYEQCPRSCKKLVRRTSPICLLRRQLWETTSFGWLQLVSRIQQYQNWI